METWRPVVGYETLYEVSDLGRVRRLAPGRNNGYIGHIHRPWLIKGYPVTELSRDGQSTTCLIHRLVAAAFLGPCPPSHEVNHIDNVKANAAASNLEYLTHAENTRHAQQLGVPMAHKGMANGSARLTDDDVREIRRWCGRVPLRELATRFHVSITAIWRIHHNLNWQHIPHEL